MSSDEEIPKIPRPARLPVVSAEAIPCAKPKKRSEVLAAGALFMALLGVLTAAASVVTVAMF